jgi:hypothetical protein
MKLNTSLLLLTGIALLPLTAFAAPADDKQVLDQINAKLDALTKHVDELAEFEHTKLTAIESYVKK